MGIVSWKHEASATTLLATSSRRAPPLGRGPDRTKSDWRRVMATAYIEEPRATRYRQRLAELLRRPSCRWISFTIGTAPVHRDFFTDTAASIEGLPTGGIREWNGVSHRQVQYGVRLQVLEGADRAVYSAERDLLAVPKESEFDSLDGRARLLGACVHVGLAMKGRNLQWLDSECAARIA